jgi:hypothetical protein
MMAFSRPLLWSRVTILAAMLATGCHDSGMRGSRI